MPLLTPAHLSRDAQQTIDLSVVILNWNARDFLVAALRSILDQRWHHNIEVIVVDNNSTLDDSAVTVRRDFPKVLLIANDKNIGFAAGNNLGLQKARGRYVLFLNPDTLVHEHAFDIMIEWMDAHPKAGACGPKMTYPDGRLQASCRAFPSFGAGLFRNTWLGRLWPNNPWSRGYLMEDVDHEKPRQADWLSGSALLVRREALDQITQTHGAWDERYFMYCEDIDICYRLKEAGWERWYVPAAHITHRIGGSSDWAQGAMIRQHHGSMLRFYFTHYAKGLGVLSAPLAVAGIGARAGAAVAKLWWKYAKMGLAGVMLKRKLRQK
jgi:GT2 family glycosyltransferase